MMGLTARQAECLRFIVSHIEEAGCAPTFDEMRDHLGVSSRSGVHRLLEGLESRGAIRRFRGQSRAIEVLPSRDVLASFSNAALLAEVERRGLST